MARKRTHPNQKTATLSTVSATKQPRKPRQYRKSAPQLAWWTIAMDYLGNYILLLMISGLIVWLALIFRRLFNFL